MASISTIHTTVSSEVESTLTSFTEVVESAVLTKGKTYYIICHALVDGNAANKVFEWRLVDRTNSDTVLSNSTMLREPHTMNETQSYYFVGRVTARGDGGGIAFEQKASTGKTVRTQYISMMIMDLSEMDSEDIFFANDATTAAHTGTFANRASLTVSRPTSGDIYLMFAWVSTETNKVSINAEMRLNMVAGLDRAVRTFKQTPEVR